MPRVRRVRVDQPGLSRRRRGRGFEYSDIRGARVTDPEILERIRALAIPPAWTDVWICVDPWGHIQATGLDAAGRRQYLYHERWRRWRDRQKFRRMPAFARALPELRATVARHVGLDGMPRERVLACAVRLLDLGSFRVGSEVYAEQNGSYGLATLRKEHVRVSGDEVMFDFVAKGGKRRILSVTDPDAREILRSLKARRNGGEDLLAYRHGQGWRDVRSSDINAYIKDVTGGSFSAKDFRTWHATVLAAVVLAGHADAGPSLTGRKRAVSSAVREVAEHLGNTPTVCRRSYVDPRVLDLFLEGEVLDLSGVGAAQEVAGRLDEPELIAAVETSVLRLLGEQLPSPQRRAA